MGGFLIFGNRCSGRVEGVYQCSAVEILLRFLIDLLACEEKMGTRR
jgi:hypothetical protein